MVQRTFMPSCQLSPKHSSIAAAEMKILSGSRWFHLMKWPFFPRGERTPTTVLPSRSFLRTFSTRALTSGVSVRLESVLGESPESGAEPAEGTDSSLVEEVSSTTISPDRVASRDFLFGFMAVALGDTTSKAWTESRVSLRVTGSSSVSDSITIGVIDPATNLGGGVFDLVAARMSTTWLPVRDRVTGTSTESIMLCVELSAVI